LDDKNDDETYQEQKAQLQERIALLQHELRAADLELSDPRELLEFAWELSTNADSLWQQGSTPRGS
jgi:hypothetical protein